MPVNLKKTEFAPAGVQAGSSSRTFHLEATGAGGKVQSKKTLPIETQTFTLTVYTWKLECKIEIRRFTQKSNNIKSKRLKL